MRILFIMIIFYTNLFLIFSLFLQGFCALFVNAAFAYAGTELVGLAAAETKVS